MKLWDQYKDALHEIISLQDNEVWGEWESKGMSLQAKTYSHPNLIKSREVEIWNDKCCICLLYTSPSPRDNRVSRMPSSA